MIPTYKRNDCLKWVLQSLVQCRTNNIPEPVRVVVVNNYPPARDEIEGIVSGFLHNDRFEWSILNREETLPPAENWFSAIEEKALPDEVVFIHADDDLLYPWSLEDRFFEITQMNGDMLLAKIDSSLYFSEKARMAYHSSTFPQETRVASCALGCGEVFLYAPQHLSNHCYRYTADFRRGLVKAFAWCHAQNWLDFNYRTLFVTLYLPYAIILEGGSVLGLDKPCVIRARDVDEIKTARYGTPGWNHGFIHGCALGVLNNDELGRLKELDVIRELYIKTFTSWFFTYFFDARIGKKKTFEMIRNIKFPVSRIISRRLLYGVYYIGCDILNLTGMRLSRRCASYSTTTESFMNSLNLLSKKS